MKKEKIKLNKNKFPIGMVIIMIVAIFIIGFALLNTFILAEV